MNTKVVTLLLALCLYLGLGAATSAFAEQSSPVASWEPGREKGLRLIDVSHDGAVETVQRDGSVGIRSTQPNGMVYFGIDPAVREKLGKEVYVVCEFFDEALSMSFLHFSSGKMSYEPVESFATADSKKWLTFTSPLKNVSFSGRQNNGADFRLATSGVIRKVALYKADPGIRFESNIARLKEYFQKASPHVPPAMSYYLGLDVTDTTVPFAKHLGASAMQTYLTWADVQPENGVDWDWSKVDAQVDILRKNNLKWLPMLILSPAYTVPVWFRGTDEHHPTVCLEHGVASKNESLWSPAIRKRVEAFIQAFAVRYGKDPIVEGVVLGIQGDFGEAIYPATAGVWATDLAGQYHTHYGFWCGEPEAIISYRAYLKKRYPEVAELNRQWHTEFASHENVGFPAQGEANIANFRGRAMAREPGTIRQWLDFIDWYSGEMTSLADWWLRTARKAIPGKEIFLCTGGDNRGALGANLVGQVKLASSLSEGIRLTNEASDPGSNFAVTGLVSSAARFYNVPLGLEPAGPESTLGVAARFFNATGAGAHHLFDYTTNLSSNARSVKFQGENLSSLFTMPIARKPVAIWYSHQQHMLDDEFTARTQMPTIRAIRDLTDAEIVDSQLLAAGILDQCKVLIIPTDGIMETADALRIAEWQKSGGQVVSLAMNLTRSVEGTDEPEKILNASKNTHVVDSVKKLAEILPSLLGDGKPFPELVEDGLFWSNLEDRGYLVFNNTDAPRVFRLKAGNSVVLESSVPAESLSIVPASKSPTP